MNTTTSPLRALIAIDFGQTGSGYSWVFFEEKKVRYNHTWPNPFLRFHHKTRTALLYNADGLVDWGDTAVNRAAGLLEAGHRKGYYLPQAFKLELHKGKPGHEGPIYRGTTRRKVVPLVTDYLRCMKEFALENVRKSASGHLDEEQVLWCLTVPAIWTEDDKHWMRIAAQRAGLIRADGTDSNRLCLVLEPEAAALYCQQEDANTGISGLTPGRCYMLVDAGGGTVDITVHSVLPNGGLEEVVKGDGGDCGSTAIDSAFRRHLTALFGERVVQQFRARRPVGWMELTKTFEEVKCSYERAKFEHDKYVYVNLPPALVKLLRDDFPDVYGEFSRGQGHRTDRISLSRATMEKLFHGVLTEIVRLIRQQLDRLADLKRRCDYIFVVGGFANSALLQERLQHEFKGKVDQIVFPTNPGVAVMVGASYYGLEPSRLVSRLSRMSYGVQLSEPFVPGEDDERQRGEGAESDRCPRRFVPFVLAGQSIAYDKPVTLKLRAVFPELETGTLPVYASPRNDVRYTDEDGRIRRLGELKVQMPTDNTEVEVSMFFGQTEFDVKARNLSTGEAVAASFSYACETSNSPTTSPFTTSFTAPRTQLRTESDADQ